MKFKVILDVDGTKQEEEVNAPDAKLAMSKALKLHPVKVEGVVPMEEQLEIRPEDHPGQEAIPDPAMEAIGDALAAEAGGGEDLSGPRQDAARDMGERVVAVSSEDLEPDGSVWDDIGTGDEALA